MVKHPRKRHNRWIDIGFSFIIISLLIIGAVLLFTSGPKQSATNSSDLSDEKNSPTTIDKIDSNYPGIKIITETSNDTFAPFAIQYPQSTQREFNEAISSYINKTKQKYIESMALHKEDNEKVHGELNISFLTHPHNSGNYSFVLNTSSFTDNSNSMAEIRTFQLNPENGEITNIKDLLDNQEENLTQIAELVKNKLLNDKKIKNDIIQDKLDSAMLPKWNNFTSFALTEDELIFYFDQSQFTNSKSGTPTVKISLLEIEKQLAQPFKPITEVEAPDKTENETVEKTQENNEDMTDETNTAPESSENTSTSPIEDDSNEKIVALTFDDGPHPTVTRQILETLEKHDAKATFFMLGSRVDYYPEIAKEVQEAGHELGNHSWNHPDLTKMSGERVFNEIKNTSNVIEKSTGQPATVFRPPYGAQNDTVRNQTDLPIILWDVDTMDWKHHDAEKTLAIIKETTKNGSNILMHDIHQSTADALDNIISYLKSEGFSFVTVSELDQ